MEGVSMCRSRRGERRGGEPAEGVGGAWRLSEEGVQSSVGLLSACCASVLGSRTILLPLLCRRTPLHYAAANGSYQCAVTLVTAGAGVNEADCKGCSPLHYAAASDTYRR